MAPEPTTHRTSVTADEITAVMSAELYVPDTLGMLAHRVHLLRGLPYGANDPRVADGNVRKALDRMIAAGTVVSAKASDIPTRNDPAALIGARSIRKGATYYALAERAEAFRKEREAEEITAVRNRDIADRLRAVLGESVEITSGVDIIRVKLTPAQAIVLAGRLK